MDATDSGAATLMVNDAEAVLPPASVTVALTVKDPDCVGAPVMSPLFETEMPPGAPDREYRYDGSPPDADTCMDAMELFCVADTFPIDETASGAATSTRNGAEAVLPSRSVTFGAEREDPRLRGCARDETAA